MQSGGGAVSVSVFICWCNIADVCSPVVVQFQCPYLCVDAVRGAVGREYCSDLLLTHINICPSLLWHRSPHEEPANVLAV
jgi:hypothetical protein